MTIKVLKCWAEVRVKDKEKNGIKRDSRKRDSIGVKRKSKKVREISSQLLDCVKRKKKR